MRQVGGPLREGHGPRRHAPQRKTGSPASLLAIEDVPTQPLQSLFNVSGRLFWPQAEQWRAQYIQESLQVFLIVFTTPYSFKQNYKQLQGPDKRKVCK